MDADIERANGKENREIHTSDKPRMVTGTRYKKIARRAGMKLQTVILSAMLSIVILLSFMVVASGGGHAADSATNRLTNTNASWRYVGASQQNVWYSNQTMVNPDNVGGLKLAWRAHLPEVSGTPVIYDGDVYVSSGAYGPGGIYALNESTGALIWSTGSGAGSGLNFTTEGGVTVDNQSVFGGTEDSYLVSLNARTGALNWKVPITQGIVGNPAGYYEGPQAIPLVHSGEVIISDTEGDVGSRGFVRSFNETTGALLWTFYTVPPSPIGASDQQEYHNTWGNCVECGGGAVWNVPAVDPQKGIIYFGVGNPAPSYNSSQRAPFANDTNLYTDSVVALNITTGKLIWYFQEIPADPHDWDQGMPVAVFKAQVGGKVTEIVGAGSKGGYYYELNASNGALIHRVSLGIHYNTNAKPTPSGAIVYPGSFGGVNTYSSYNPMTNMIYAMAYNQPSNYTEGPIDFEGGGQGLQGSVDNPVPGVPGNSTLYAIDASTGTIAWSKDMEGLGGGASSTNELVFTQDGSQNYYSLDALTGKVLWSYAPASSDPYLGLWNWGPPSVADGKVFETLFGSSGGGVLAFSANTSIVDTSLPTSTTTNSNTSRTSITTSSSSLFSRTQNNLSSAYPTGSTSSSSTVADSHTSSSTSVHEAISSSSSLTRSADTSTNGSSVASITNTLDALSSPPSSNQASLVTTAEVVAVVIVAIGSGILIVGARGSRRRRPPA